MRVLLICDGGGPIGVGHVIRSLALAEAAVAAGHEVKVAGQFEGSFVQDQLASAPVEVTRLPASMAEGGVTPASARGALTELVQRYEPDLLHVDSYAPVDRPAGSFVLSNMEDGPFGRRPADVVVDPTFGAEIAARPDDGSIWLLRGSRFTPIRQRVLDARRSAEVVGTMGDSSSSVARSVLVVMGGTDPVGLAPAAVGLLARTGLPLDVTVIAVGEDAEQVHAAAVGSRLSVNVLAPVDDLATVMARQDLVISAAGSSVWELCCIGVPMALIWAVTNQRSGYDRVVAAGAAMGLGGPDLGVGLGADDLGRGEECVTRLRTALTDSRVRADLALAGRRIVDGLGSWRVVRTWEMAARQRRTGARSAQLPDVANPGLVARRATLEDARLLWEWRNDPATRAASRHREPVSWPDHLAWLEASLTRSDRKLFMVDDEIGLGPVGTVRWDRAPGFGDEPEWEVSIAVAPERRGQSLARPLLFVAEVMLTEVAHYETPPAAVTDVTAYLAVVHVDNLASVRLFEGAGYLPDLPPDPDGFMRFRKLARVA